MGVGLAVFDQLILWEDARAAVAEAKVLDWDIQGGGMVATALVAVARLGGGAEFWGAVGSDWMGERILQGLREEGVDVSQVLRVQGASGPVVLVCVDRATGERHFRYWRGFEDPPGRIGSPERLTGAGCLLVDGTRVQSALAVASEARRRGLPVVGDFGSVRGGAGKLLPLADYAIASEGCARQLSSGGDWRQACREIQRLGPRCVVVTMGSRGLICLEGERFLEMPAFAVEVVDTTGAGDVFHGAFCLGLVEGFGLEENLRFASAVAALKCRRLGGRAGIPTRPEVEQFLRDRGEGGL